MIIPGKLLSLADDCLKATRAPMRSKHKHMSGSRRNKRHFKKKKASHELDQCCCEAVGFKKMIIN